MLCHIQYGLIFTIKLMRTLGKRLKDMWIIQELIFMRANLKTITLNLKQMQSALVLQECGKYMLIKILSLPLLLVLRRQLETPPTTPFPKHLPPPCPPHNGHHPPTADTAEKHLALQPPPGGKKDKEKKPSPGEEKPDQGPGAESNGGGGKPKDPPPEEPPNPPGGEGEVEGGPSPDPDQDPDHQSLLQGVALHLVKWERHFDQLVDTVVEDLRNYWMQLKTPQ